MDAYGGVVLACQVILLAWTACLCLSASGSELRRWVQSIGVLTTWRCLGEIWQCCCNGSADDKRVAMLLAERRTRRMRIVAKAGMIAKALHGTAIVANIVTGKPRLYTAWMDIATIITSLITIGFNVWPGLLSRMPNVLYSAWMAWTALNISPAVESADPMVATIWFIVRILCSMAILDMRTIIFWNFVSGICAWCTFAFMWKDRQCAAVHVTEYNVAMKEFCSLILVVAISYSFKHGIAAEIREKMRANASRRECGAASSLLRAMSDVVVKLDDSLRVSGDNPTLAALLLRESVRDTSFERLLFGEEDRQLFHDRIANTIENEMEAITPWRMRLRDGVGTRVMAECFHTQLEDVVGKSFHLMGIREVQAEPEAEAQAIALRPQPMPQTIGSSSVSTSVVPQPKQIQATPMPNELFLELILQECNGIPSPTFGTGATVGRRAASNRSRLSRSRGSKASSRSRTSSRSGASRNSRRSSRSVREPETGSITNLREAGTGNQVEAYHSGRRGRSPPRHVLVDI